MCRDGEANAADVRWLIGQIAARYAYLAGRHIDLDKLRTIYIGEADAACDPHSFLNTLERCLAELHDHHIEAGVNNALSPQLVPTGAEVWASFRNGEAVVEAVRPASGMASAGVRAGDRITAIAGVPVHSAVTAAAPRALSAPDPEADDYTLRVLLAGTHSARRLFTIAGKTIDLPPHESISASTPLTVRNLEHGIVCLHVENSLGDPALVPAIDAALDAAKDARGLILDLRETPSGGNTGIAEPILGRFIAGTQSYQRVREHDGREYVRKVTARGATVTTPLVVLCSRWTGSMGEGMSIGLDGMKRAAVVGTRMAGLCGATEGITLPKSGIRVFFPVERLYHLDGTPREHWAPPQLVDLATATGDDPILARGVAMLRGG
jgi:carboxyl-terminal processing protease